MSVVDILYQKHLGMDLDENLNFNIHVTENIVKANKGIGIIWKLANTTTVFPNKH